MLRKYEKVCKSWGSIRKCTKCWESMRKYSKCWESIRKCAKCWESIRKCAKCWESAQNVENVWESTPNVEKDYNAIFLIHSKISKQAVFRISWNNETWNCTSFAGPYFWDPIFNFFNNKDTL